MMRAARTGSILGVAVAAVIATAYFQVARADDDTIPAPTDAQLQTISRNCNEIKTTLQQLEYADTLTRVNQGQLYEEVSSDLMAPMNSRIALNHFDGSALLSTSATYARQLSDFRTAYQAYGDALRVVLQDNCADSTKFYTKLMSARQARFKLGDATKTLNDSIKTYQQQFSDFAKTLPATSEDTNG